MLLDSAFSVPISGTPSDHPKGGSFQKKKKNSKDGCVLL
jgi:hypothetical protein